MLNEFTLDLRALDGRSGRGVRIAVVDSGIHGDHPHVLGISGGTAIDDEGRHGADLVDRLGHGTAVAAAIREKAPDAELLAVKVFDRTLAATGRALVEAIGWAAMQKAPLVNLSLGTTNPQHESALLVAVGEALGSGTIVVAAAPEAGRRWLPGALAGVVSVEVDWACPREAIRVQLEPEGHRVRVRASGYPRPIPGVPIEKNLRGISFAVANATGFLARAMESAKLRTLGELAERLSALANPPHSR